MWGASAHLRWHRRYEAMFFLSVALVRTLTPKRTNRFIASAITLPHPSTFEQLHPVIVETRVRSHGIVVDLVASSALMDLFLGRLSAILAERIQLDSCHFCVLCRLFRLRSGALELPVAGFKLAFASNQTHL